MSEEWIRECEITISRLKKALEMADAIKDPILTASLKKQILKDIQTFEEAKTNPSVMNRFPRRSVILGRKVILGRSVILRKPPS